MSSKELGGDPYTLEWQGSWWALRGSATDGDGCDITRRRRVARAPPRGAGAGRNVDGGARATLPVKPKTAGVVAWGYLLALCWRVRARASAAERTPPPPHAR